MYIRTECGLLFKLIDSNRYLMLGNYNYKNKIFLINKVDNVIFKDDYTSFKIKSQSKNLIDILEVGDILINDFETIDYLDGEYAYTNQGQYSEDEIKSIVTKEQYLKLAQEV